MKVGGMIWKAWEFKELAKVYTGLWKLVEVMGAGRLVSWRLLEVHETRGSR